MSEDDSVRGVLRALGRRLAPSGLKHRGSTFVLEREGNRLDLKVRRRGVSRGNTAITFDASIVSRRLAEWSQRQRTWLPPVHAEYRVPTLVIGEDRWWSVPTGVLPNRQEELASEIAEMLLAAFPFLTRAMSDIGLRDQWAAAPMLADHERHWLRVLEQALGPSPSAGQPEKPSAADEVATAVVRRLREKGIAVEGPAMVQPGSVDPQSSDLADEVVSWIEELAQERNARARVRKKNGRQSADKDR